MHHLLEDHISKYRLMRRDTMSKGQKKIYASTMDGTAEAVKRKKYENSLTVTAFQRRQLTCIQDIPEAHLCALRTP